MLIRGWLKRTVGAAVGAAVRDALTLGQISANSGWELFSLAEWNFAFSLLRSEAAIGKLSHKSLETFFKFIKFMSVINAL